MSPQKKKKTTVKRDLLIREELEESKETIRDLKRERDLLIKALDGTGVGVVLEDKRGGEYEVLNKGVSKITGYSPGELSSPREWSRRLRTQRVVGKKAGGSAGRPGRPRRSAVEDFAIRTKGGKDRIMRVRSMPLRHDPSGGKKVLNVITDVTEEIDVRGNLNYYRDFTTRLFNHSVDGICILDSGMRISSLNRALLTNSGYKRKDLIGKSATKFMPPEFRKEVKGLFKQAMDHGFIPTTRMQLYVANRQRVGVEVSGVCLYDPTRNKRGVMVYIHDISVRLSREHRLRRLSSVVYNSPVPIVELDVENRIRYANVAFEKLFGYSRRSVVGKHVRFLHHRPSFSEVEKEIRRSLKRMGQWMGELWLRKRDRSSFPAEVMKSATYDSEGVQTGYTTFYCDMTQRKKAEEARAERTDRLERLVEARTDKLVETEEMLGRFLRYTKDGVIIVNPRRQIIDVNGEMLRMLDYSRDDVVGKPFGAFCQKASERTGLFGDLRAKGTIRNRDIRLLTRNGEVRAVNGTIWSDKNHSGKALRYVGVFRDVTDRLKAEEALRESEERLRSIYDNTMIGLYRTTPGGRILMVNPALLRMLGYSSFKELAKRNLEKKGYPPEHPRSRFKELIERKGKVVGLESVWIKRDGSTLFVRENARAVRDQSGKTLYYEGSVEDITEYKKTEKAFRESEEKYHITIDSMEDSVHLVDRDLRIVLANRSFRKWIEDLGLRKELIGRTVFESFPFLSSSVRKEYEKVLKSGKTFITEENNVINGREIFTETRKIPAFEGGKVGHVITIIRDISDQRAVLKSLKHRVELERLLTSISTRFINISSDEVEGAIKRALNVLGEFTGVDRAQVYLLSDDGKFMKNTYEWCAKKVKPQREELREVPVVKFPWAMARLRRFENIRAAKIDDLPKNAAAERRRFRKHNIKSTLAIPMALEGSLLGFFSFDSLRSEKTWAEEDIAVLKTVGEIFSSALQRKRIEEALRESEATALALLDGVKEPMLLLNTDGTVIAASEVVAKNAGKTADQLAGSRLYDHFTSKAARFRSGKVNEVLRTKGPLRFEDDSTDRIYETTIQPVFDDKGEVVRLAIIARDITDRKNLEQQLFLSAKLASLGGFVARIAHEINNPLASIKLDIERMRKKAELAKDCENVLGTIGRISEIVDNLLKYARGRRAVLRPNDVEDIVKSALELVRKRFADERKSIITKFRRPKATIYSDFGQLQQVFLNLAMNACDALKERGTLEIRTSRVAPSNEVRVVFRDNGKGLSKADLGRVFDPFFTTRASGTGLGLSISHKIIENHNGRIELKSALGKGTEVTITLPASRAETGRKKKRKPR